MAGKFGVKEILDWSVALKQAADSLESALDDNKIDWRDWRELGPLLERGNDALRGSSLIASEIKDMDIEEAKEVVESFVISTTAFYGVIRKIVGNNGPAPAKSAVKPVNHKAAGNQKKAAKVDKKPKK